MNNPVGFYEELQYHNNDTFVVTSGYKPVLQRLRGEELLIRLPSLELGFRNQENEG